MDVETRNICFCDHDQKMWFRCYTECILFFSFFMLFPDNNRPIVNDFEENRVKKKKKENVTRADRIFFYFFYAFFPSTGGKLTQQPTAFCYVNVPGSNASLTLLFLQFFSSVPLLTSVISKSSLYIFL